MTEPGGGPCSREAVALLAAILIAGVLVTVAVSVQAGDDFEPVRRSTPPATVTAEPTATPTVTETTTGPTVTATATETTTITARATRTVTRAARSSTRTSPPVAAKGTVWDRLAECESGGDWSANTGNGFYGGLQFMASTWRMAGGERYASRADLATREQQIEIAQDWLARTSWSQWPVCSKRIGVR